MTSTAVAVHHAQGLALAPDQDYWSQDQLTAIRHLGVGQNVSRADMQVFHHVCQRTGLDPFARQIYMIERRGDDGRPKQTIQTGIDGYRLIARRAVDATGETLTADETLWCADDGQWRDVWLSDEPPAAAKVTIVRGTGRFTAVALWREYRQTKKDGNLTRMWSTRSAGQLAKCAEALALRKAFPLELAGIYTDDEISDRAPAVTAATAAETGADRMRAMLSDIEPETTTEPTDVGDAPEAITDGQITMLHILLKECDLGDREARLAWLSDETGREIATSKTLTKTEGSACIEALQRLKALRDMPEPELDGQA